MRSSPKTCFLQIRARKRQHDSPSEPRTSPHGCLGVSHRGGILFYLFFITFHPPRIIFQNPDAPRKFLADKPLTHPFLPLVLPEAAGLRTGHPDRPHSQ